MSRVYIGVGHGGADPGAGGEVVVIGGGVVFAEQVAVVAEEGDAVERAALDGRQRGGGNFVDACFCDGDAVPDARLQYGVGLKGLALSREDYGGQQEKRNNTIRAHTCRNCKVKKKIVRQSMKIFNPSCFSVSCGTFQKRVGKRFKNGQKMIIYIKICDKNSSGIRYLCVCKWLILKYVKIIFVSFSAIS